MERLSLSTSPMSMIVTVSGRPYRLTSEEELIAFLAAVATMQRLAA